MAFPGGRNEEGENDLDTVVREVQEEVGLDLNSNDFVKLGCLDDREITSLLGGKPFMILSTFGNYLELDGASCRSTSRQCTRRDWGRFWVIGKWEFLYYPFMATSSSFFLAGILIFLYVFSLSTSLIGVSSNYPPKF